MTDTEIYDLYVLQSKNVRKLKKVESNLIRTINFHLNKNDAFQVELNTKLLALLYCTLSEAQFIQMVNTPKGFQYSEIEKIKNEKSRNGIVKAWEIMLDLAFEKVNSNWQENGDLNSRRIQLKGIIEKYIKEPSELRNKIAHGQWDIALNRENTKENVDKTNELRNLNVITITVWSNIHQFLGLMIRDLIQSPQVAFHNNYWSNLEKLNRFVIKSDNWTMAKRKDTLRPRKQKTSD